MGSTHLGELSLVRLRDARDDVGDGWAHTGGNSVDAVVLSGRAVDQVLSVAAEVR